MEKSTRVEKLDKAYKNFLHASKAIFKLGFQEVIKEKSNLKNELFALEFDMHIESQICGFAATKRLSEIAERRNEILDLLAKNEHREDWIRSFFEDFFEENFPY